MRLIYFLRSFVPALRPTTCSRDPYFLVISSGCRGHSREQVSGAARRKNAKLLFIFCISVVTGCAIKNPIKEPLLLPAHQIAEKTTTIPPPTSTIDYHLEDASNPALAAAYTQYLKTGAAKTIATDQFVQFPYNAGSQPVIAASVLELTIISLEPGEHVNNVSSGDPLRWSYSLAYSGSNNLRQAHVMVKPAKPNISTDFFITTDRRAYLLKLVAANNGKYTREVRFWYPDSIQQQNVISQDDVIAELPLVDLSQLNFNYRLTSGRNSPDWMPHRVFDDGKHTYIQFPLNITAADMPALFIQHGNNQEMVNYRVKTPYFIVDKVFQTAVLISGTGRQQQKITITALHSGKLL